MTQHGRPAFADITKFGEVLDQKLEPIRRAVMEHATNTVSASGVSDYAGKPSCLWLACMRRRLKNGHAWLPMTFNRAG